MTCVWFYASAVKVKRSFPVFSAENYCYLNTAFYPELEDMNQHFLEIDEERDFKCAHRAGWRTDHYSRAHCSGSRTVTFSKCE